jgi:hypothetical protein
MEGLNKRAKDASILKQMMPSQVETLSKMSTCSKLRIIGCLSCVKLVVDATELKKEEIGESHRWNSCGV